MSSPIKIDSLSGLAEIVEKVDMFATGMCAIDRRTFDELREHINVLQVCCPNHKGVLEARVKWYEFALDSFEKHVVVSLEQSKFLDFRWSPNTDWVPDLLCDHTTLEHFMRRPYLKDAFPRLYKRLLQLLRRFVEALQRNHSDALQPWAVAFVATIESFEVRLLEGRL
jgi:hypothetical protein